MKKLAMLIVFLLVFSGEVFSSGEQRGAKAFTWSGGGAGVTPLTVNPPLFNCGAWGQGSNHQAGNCGITFPTDGDVGAFWLGGSPNGATPGMSGTAINMIPTGSVHNGISIIFQGQVVPIGQFTATWVWVHNGWNIAFIVENSTNQSGFTGKGFASGASCEGGFFQGFSSPTPPDNVFAVQFDSTQYIKEADGAFTYSGVGVFQANVAGWSNVYVQCPCIPMASCGTNNTPTAITTQKVSTSPVPLNSPPTTAVTTTGDTYQGQVSYDGTTLTVTLTDLTVGGSVTKTWSPISISTAVGGTKAWVGLTASTNAASTAPLLVNSFVYSVPSPL